MYIYNYTTTCTNNKHNNAIAYLVYTWVLQIHARTANNMCQVRTSQFTGKKNTNNKLESHDPRDATLIQIYTLPND